jgi:hypothetical protein
MADIRNETTSIDLERYCYINLLSVCDGHSTIIIIIFMYTEQLKENQEM